MDLNLDEIYDLATVPDVIGLRARWPGAPVVKVLLGRDPHSVRTLVPDPDVHYRGVHDVTIEDIGNTAGPTVSVADLSLLRLQWPVTVLSSLSWHQQDLERMQTISKNRYRSTPVAACSFCRKWIKLDMHHVVTFHLCKAHVVPKEVKTANMGQWFPSWTVRREVWADALKSATWVSRLMCYYSVV